MEMSAGREVVPAAGDEVISLPPTEERANISEAAVSLAGASALAMQKTVAAASTTVSKLFPGAVKGIVMSPSERSSERRYRVFT